MGCRRGRGLVENEEQDENKKMKSIVVEEQEQEQEEGSETRFVDLDQDTLLNVLERVDSVTLGRAACVNKLWREVADDERLWEPIYIRHMASRGMLQYVGRNPTIVEYLWFIRSKPISDIVKPPPDFYSIDFSKKITPWRENEDKISLSFPTLRIEEEPHNRG